MSEAVMYNERPLPHLQPSLSEDFYDTRVDFGTEFCVCCLLAWFFFFFLGLFIGLAYFRPVARRTSLLQTCFAQRIGQLSSVSVQYGI